MGISKISRPFQWIVTDDGIECQDHHRDGRPRELLIPRDEIGVVHRETGAPAHLVHLLTKEWVDGEALIRTFEQALVVHADSVPNGLTDSVPLGWQGRARARQATLAAEAAHDRRVMSAMGDPLVFSYAEYRAAEAALSARAA